MFFPDAKILQTRKKTKRKVALQNLHLDGQLMCVQSQLQTEVGNIITGTSTHISRRHVMITELQNKAQSGQASKSSG